ncbi:MAG: hypothetical protein EBU90_27125 [Proteobacteria bacterium]|nr:hypothetical protein [Pseudomonadota bacterium]
MAILNQIGGISTGGLTGVLKGPLDKLFGNTNIPYQYQYPANLGNDPSRMHIVQFTISNVIPKQFDVVAAYDSISQTKREELGAKAQAVTAKAADVAKNLQAYLKPDTKKTATVISLYMPDSLSMNYHAEYSELSIMDATNSMNRVAGAVGSIIEDLQKGGVGGDNIKNSLVKAANEYGPEASLRLLDTATRMQTTDLGLRAMGMAINPQLQLLYKGVGFRTFTMEFLFTPKTKEEADQVSAIVNSFVYAAAPTVQTQTGGMYFTPPSVFNMRFLMAKSGSFSGLSAMLQKAGNSIIPGVPLGNAVTGIKGIGDKGSVSNGVENDRLYKVGDCVLEDISVDYAPNGWAAHTGGAPVQTRLTLSFKEIDILDRTRMTATDVTERVR